MVAFKCVFLRALASRAACKTRLNWNGLSCFHLRFGAASTRLCAKMGRSVERSLKATQLGRSKFRVHLERSDSELELKRRSLQFGRQPPSASGMIVLLAHSAKRSHSFNVVRRWKLTKGVGFSLSVDQSSNMLAATFNSSLSHLN